MRATWPGTVYALLAAGFMAGCATAARPARLPLQVEAAIGPFDKAQLSIGFADVPSENGMIAEVAQDQAHHRLPFDSPSLDFFVVAVQDVKIVDVWPTPGNEILILYTSRKLGPQMGAEYSMAAFGWQQGQFVALPELEARLSGPTSLKAALRRLESLKP